jgi:uncharacterized protein
VPSKRDDRPFAKRVFQNEHRLRSGWRILLFVLLFAVFTFVGQVALAALPPDALFWVSPAVLLVAALAAGWILIARLDGRPVGALGFPVYRPAAREVGLGLLIGCGLLSAVVLLLLVTRTVAWQPDDGTLVGFAGMMVASILFFAVAAAWEEAFFRGYPFQVLVGGIGAWPAMLLFSALFAFAHGQNPQVTWLALANIFLASILLSVAYLRTRSLWFATALHAGWNWMMAFVLDLPVSGLTAFDTPGYSGVERGPHWWTGGEFGPEAGIAATIVLLLGILWLTRTRLIGTAREMREMGPIVDRRLGEEWG